MKWNWGYSVILAMAIFITGILYVIITINSKGSDLVEDNYYERTVEYQNIIDQKNSLNALNGTLEVTNEEEGIRIVFPTDFGEKQAKGFFRLSRAANSSLDVNKTFDVLSNKGILIPKEQLTGGKYDLELRFMVSGKKYYYKNMLYWN